MGVLMDRHLRLAFAGAVLLTTAACSGNRGDCALFGAPADEADRSGNAKASPAPPQNAGTPSSSSPAAIRAIAEADIVQLDDEQDRIYAMSKSGTLAIVDAAQPGTLTLMGKTALADEPFEMYRRGDVLLTMSNHAVQADGNLQPPQPEGAAPRAPDAAAGAIVAAVDISNPAAAKTTATLKVAGEIADSRVIGNILYLATYENAACWSCGTKPRTLVTSFDITAPTAPKQVDQISYETAPGTGGFNAAWSTPWKRSIIATATRLYVGGLASDQGTTTDEGVIEVIDITDPTGHLTRGAKITMAGPVMSRWQMDEHEGVLRVISQRGAGRTSNGEKYPDIDTFRIESSSSLVRIGHTTMTLPRQEGLKTVRFDGARAYAITFNQTDPLFTIDLADATKPTQKGELHIPGWMFHLEPRGDKLLGLGLDRTDKEGNVNVSLFDVADMTNPTLIKRVSFGPSNMYEDYQITNGVLAEDQDRIQKAFRIFPDGLVAVPFSSGKGECSSNGGGVQLLDWAGSSLVKRGLVPVAGNPRRAVRRDSAAIKELIAISDSNVSAFSIEQRDTPVPLADVVIGTCVTRTTPNGGDLGFGGGPRGGGFEGGGGSDYSSRGWGGSCY